MQLHEVYFGQKREYLEINCKKCGKDIGMIDCTYTIYDLLEFVAKLHCAKCEPPE